MSSNGVSFTFDGKPVPASRPRVTQRGTFYPKAHTQHKKLLDNLLLTNPKHPTELPVEVRMMFVMPRYKTSDHPVHRTDVDNLAKLPMDCMTKSEDEEGHRYWKDDDLIVNLTCLKRFVREGEEPHTKVRVIPITGSVEDHVDEVFNH